MATLLLFVVLMATAGAYVRTLGFDFVYDDQLQIVKSPAAHSWRFLPKYFATDVWRYAEPWSTPTYYRPIFLVWLLINYSLFGLDSSWWHFTTIAVHLAATLLLYVMARRLTGDWAVAGIAALVFGLHPVHVEAVAWVSGVTEPLLAVLILSSFLCYANWRNEDRSRPRPGWLAASLTLYALALLEKETAAVFPAIISAYEWILRRPGRNRESGNPWERAVRALSASGPFLILSAAYLTIRVAVLGALRLSTSPLPLSTLVFTEPGVILFYLKQLIWPVGLSPFYDVPYVTGPVASTFVLPAIIVTLVTVPLCFWSRRSRSAGFASVWIIVSLLPVLNPKAFGLEELVHDRYLYLPSMGFAILVGLAVCQLRISHFRILGRPLEQHLVVLAIGCLLAFRLVGESKPWENNLSLFRHGVSMAPGNSLAKETLAFELGTLGTYQEAIPLLHSVLELRPRSFEANADLGRYYYITGVYSRAELYLLRAVEIRPDVSRVPYAYLGLTRLELGRLDAAEDAIRKGLEVVPLDSDNRLIHSAFGEVLKRRGDLQGALKEFRLEVANNPAPGAFREQVARLEAQLQRNR